MLTLNTNTIGGISELKVVCDLLSKGYEVYRPLIDNASCDLIVLKDNKLTRIEVKTTYRNTGGEIRKSTVKNWGKFDILACVLPEGIVYEPDLI